MDAWKLLTKTWASLKLNMDEFGHRCWVKKEVFLSFGNKRPVLAVSRKQPSKQI